MALKNNKNNPEATPEQIAEYQKLKARNEWIKLNQDYLNQIRKVQLLYHRLILAGVILLLLFNLISLLL